MPAEKTSRRIYGWLQVRRKHSLNSALSATVAPPSIAFKGLWAPEVCSESEEHGHEIKKKFTFISIENRKYGLWDKFIWFCVCWNVETFKNLPRLFCEMYF
jgi:hypothetical protein